MITIRNAQSDDFAMLAELGRKAFYQAFGQHNDAADMQAYLDLAFNPDTIQSQLNDKNNTFLIAYFHNNPVGYAKLKRNSTFHAIENSKVIQLERIYALLPYIGKKIGKALMEECIQIGKQEMYEFIWLSVWQENKIAIDFYNKFGFKVIGYKQFVIGKEVNDDFVMALNIKQ
jgi:diamine N-acetyltransferase